MLTLYGHPFSSYTWKALIALYEKTLPFDFHVIDGEHPENGAALNRHWPLGKFPVLKNGESVVIESTIIIEHLDLSFPETPKLIPADPKTALHVRFFDRIFDNHVMGPMQSIVAEHIPFITQTPDIERIARAQTSLLTIYEWLEEKISVADWACGADFTLADCAAAPSLFYADWVHPIPRDMKNLKTYRTRLLDHPSVVRAVDGGRPFRHFFPLGAPDRD